MVIGSVEGRRGRVMLGGAALVVAACGASAWQAAPSPPPAAANRASGVEVTPFTLRSADPGAPTLHGKLWRRGDAVRIEVRSPASAQVPRPPERLVASLIVNPRLVAFVAYDQRTVFHTAAMYGTALGLDTACARMVITQTSAVPRPPLASAACMAGPSVVSPRDGERVVELLTGTRLWVGPTATVQMSDHGFTFAPTALPRFARR